MKREPKFDVIEAVAEAEPAPERKYRAVNPFAVASFVFGVLSVLTVLHWAMGAVPAAGATLAWLAFNRYRRNPEDQTGIAFARWGLGLSLGLGIVGYCYLIYAWHTEAPPGYQKISFKDLQPTNAEERVPVTAEKELDKRRVYIHGYIFRTRQQSDIKDFVLTEDKGCAFCGVQPKPTQLIRVRLQTSVGIDYTTRLIGVGGELTVDTNLTDRSMGGLYYRIDADVVK